MLDEKLSRVRDRVPGMRGVFLVGLDGVAAAGAGHEEPLAWEPIVAGYADLLSRATSTNRESALEGPVELIVSTRTTVVLLRGLNQGYFLLAGLDDVTALGRARFELHKAADELVDDLQ